MLRAALAIFLFMMVGSMASAAIIYAPVQYQYRDPVMSAPTFYYGGSDPLVFEQAVAHQQRFNTGPSSHYIGTSYAREGRFGFNVTNNAMLNTLQVTYSDLLPTGINAYPQGFSISDARNAAYANVPLYFRKRDLLASAYRTADGHVIVPAQAPLPGTIEIKPMHAPTTQPATSPAEPSPILIIPKRLLNKPLNAGATPVALAR
jgi:hypothetical protein